MRSIISKSMMLGLALAAVSGCSTDSSNTPDSSGAKVQAKVVLPDSTSISSVDYQVTCGSFVRSGSWNVSNSATISGVVGGMADGATCTIELWARDSTVPASTDPATRNCHAAIANVTAHAGNTRPTTANLSMVCQRGETSARGQVGSITGLTTVSVAGNSHVCASIQDYLANPGEVYVGSSIALSGTVLPGTNSDGTTPADLGTMTMTKAATDPNTLTQTASGWTYACGTAGTYTITVAVSDSYVAPSGQACGVNSDTFQVVCTDTGTGGTGGNTSTGGASSTGGAETGGAATGTGGAETGGAATGGAETGGAATGGAGTGGAATGGAGTGGAAVIVVTDDLTALAAQGSDCSSCAQSACGDIIGALGCGYFTGSYNAVSNWAGNSNISPVAVGQSVSQTLVCGTTLSCVLSSGTLGSGSCYAPIADSATACYCGTADASTCAGGGGNGVCKAAYENSLNTTSAGTIASIFTDYNYPGGDSNYILQCLNANCASQCFHSNP